MEIRRFGVGHRRPEGPPGTTNLEAQVIHSDARGLVAELAFKRRGRISPHENPNTTWFCVIEGGGIVQVGDEQRRVGPGDAVLWPPGVTHAAWTVGTQMRAIVVEFAGPDDSRIRGILEGTARRLGAGERRAAKKAVGRVTRLPSTTAAGRGATPVRADTDAETEGEPD